MRKKRRLWQAFLVYSAFLLVFLACLAGYGFFSLEKILYGRASAESEARAQLIVPQVMDAIEARKWSDFDVLAKKLGENSDMRITFVLKSGEVAGDSEDDPARMDNHADRPEIKAALAGRPGLARREGARDGAAMIFAAVPVKKGGEVVAAVRTGLSAAAVERTLRAARVYSFWIMAVLAVFLAGSGFLISRRLAAALEAVKRGVQQFARGELKSGIDISAPMEISLVAEAMNKEAADWEEKFNAVLSQRALQDAVFSSMLEGVVAVDGEENLITLNQSAARLFQIDPEHARGRKFHEAIRNTLLRKFVGRALSSRDLAEEDIVVPVDGKERILQVRGTVLKDAQGRGLGALIVLNDVTRLRRLETVRRDFVANVSHELKTPITSIKGWVETLLDGAADDPVRARKFLEVVARQSDRLNAIIEDLLSLSRIEQEAETMSIVIEKGDILEVIEAAIADCSAKARQKDLTVKMKCDGDMRANINQPLLEQALVNLIDNAVKYSEPGKSILVQALQSASEVTVSVHDEGCGIPDDHLPRLFERFYRVDKARSRQLGGTGLGLAIVKHIAQAHRGTVEVKSSPGKGSVFSIHLPRT
ncbi:MAG: PAS domain-containing protein [Nitrospinae bacterium]|nr:PAS domain-containing protein [Nitrospinota bacterium]